MSKSTVWVPWKGISWHVTRRCVHKNVTTYNYIGQWVFRNLHKVINSLAPWWFQSSFRDDLVDNFKLILMNGGWGISEIALRWVPQYLTEDKSTLVQVMAWCRQATSHNLNQCWPRFVSPNGVTGPQWVKNYERIRCVSGTWKYRFSAPLV